MLAVDSRPVAVPLARLAAHWHEHDGGGSWNVSLAEPQISSRCGAKVSATLVRRTMDARDETWCYTDYGAFRMAVHSLLTESYPADLGDRTEIPVISV
jgi:hypothetical protein